MVILNLYFSIKYDVIVFSTLLYVEKTSRYLKYGREVGNDVQFLEKGRF